MLLSQWKHVQDCSAVEEQKLIQLSCLQNYCIHCVMHLSFSKETQCIFKSVISHTMLGFYKENKVIMETIIISELFSLSPLQRLFIVYQRVSNRTNRIFFCSQLVGSEIWQEHIMHGSFVWFNNIKDVGIYLLKLRAFSDSYYRQKQNTEVSQRRWSVFKIKHPKQIKCPEMFPVWLKATTSPFPGKLDWMFL